MATLHRQMSWGAHGRVAPQESGFARSHNRACRIAEAYAARIAEQSTAPAGDTKTQLMSPSAAAIAAKDGKRHDARCRDKQSDNAVRSISDLPNPRLAALEQWITDEISHGLARDNTLKRKE